MKEQKVNAKTPKDDQKSSPRLKEKQIIAQAWAIAEPLCLDEGMELVFIEFRRETQGRVLRLYIDKHGGVTVDDCANISRQMGDILDATLEDIGPYSMEVSSPGINRPLGRPQDYDRFKGNRAHIKTLQSINGRRNFKGILRGIDDDVVALQCDDKEIHLSLEEISIARLLNFNGEK